MEPAQRYKGDELLDTKIMKFLHDILSTFGDKYLTGKDLNKARIIQDIDLIHVKVSGSMNNSGLYR